MRPLLPLAAAAALLALSVPAGAIDLKSLKNKIGGAEAAQPAEAPAEGSGLLGALGSQLSLPAIGTDTAGNAAGVLEYCIRHKYLDGGVAGAVKDRLLSSAGLTSEEAGQDEGYSSGLSGLLQGSDGTSFNLDSISGQLKDRACDLVLDNASSLI